MKPSKIPNPWVSWGNSYRHRNSTTFFISACEYRGLGTLCTPSISRSATGRRESASSNGWSSQRRAKIWFCSFFLMKFARPIWVYSPVRDISTAPSCVANWIVFPWIRANTHIHPLASDLQDVSSNFSSRPPLHWCSWTENNKYAPPFWSAPPLLQWRQVLFENRQCRDIFQNSIYEKRECFCCAKVAIVCSAAYLDRCHLVVSEDAASRL